MQWFARVFVGLYLHNCLLPSTSFKKQDISNADTDPEIRRGSLGSIDRLEGRYGADTSAFVSSTKTQSSTKNYKTSDGRKAITKVEYSTPVCGYPIEYCFSGVLSFFSCFIFHFNNYMLNQCLASLIFQELHRISTQQVSNRIISKDLASIGNTSSTMPNGVGESMDINSFTLSVLISKYLGKLLGLIHFHHMWTWEKAEYDSFLNLSPLPLPDIITSGLHQGRLCQIIPWVCEYLKLAKPIMDQMSLRRTNKSYDSYLGYLSTFKLLSLLTCHRDFELWSEDLSTNK